MSGEEKNKLDQIFKDGLDVPDTRFEYHEPDWGDLEAQLDAQRKPRGIVYWLPMLSGVAAVLLLFLGWWMFKPADVEVKPVAINKQPTTQQPATANPVNSATNTVAGKIDSNSAATTGAPVNQPAIRRSLASSAQYAGTIGTHRGNKPFVNQSNGKIVTQPGAAKVNNQPFVQGTVAGQPKQEVIASNSNSSANNPVNGNATDINTNTTGTVVAGSQQVAATNAAATNTPATVADPSIPAAKKVKVTSPSKFKPQFGLAMMVSPDINGVGSFQNGKVGANIGLGFSVTIKKFTFSTGVAYSKKPYTAAYSQYQNAGYLKITPRDVTADCRVLDIPINVDYQLYHGSRNSFSVGTGLSSYLMLSEKYTYNYAQPTAYSPLGYTVTNKNQHILGVLNLSATYAHQLNSKFSIAAQPYLKVPLTNIGNSQVKLQSAGVAVGLRWNINQSNTP